MHLLMASCDKLILGETIEVTGESLCLGTVTTAAARCSARFAIPRCDEKESLAQGLTAGVYNAIYTDCCHGRLSCGANKEIGTSDVSFLPCRF